MELQLQIGKFDKYLKKLSLTMSDDNMLFDKHVVHSSIEEIFIPYFLLYNKHTELNELSEGKINQFYSPIN